MKKIIIFGAGDYGRQAYEYYGDEAVGYFVDNNTNKAGQMYCGKKILSVEEYLSIQKDYRTVIAVRSYSAIASQLREYGINNYEYYSVQYKNLLDNMKSHSSDLIDDKKVVFFGIDESAEVLIRDVKGFGLDERNIRYADLLEKGNIGSRIFSTKVEDIETASEDADFIIIASAEKSYDLQVVCDFYQSKHSFKTINPFIQEKYFETSEIIFNPYLTNPNGSDEIDEDEWNKQTQKDNNIGGYNVSKCRIRK